MANNYDPGAWLDAPPSYRATGGCSRRCHIVAVRGRLQPSTRRKEKAARCDHTAARPRQAAAVERRAVERGVWLLLALCAAGWLLLEVIAWST